MVICPSKFKNTFIPETKSLMSGACDKTLFPIKRSAFPYLSTICLAVSSPKNLDSVLIPFFTAQSATLAAGSMPKQEYLSLQNIEVNNHRCWLFLQLDFLNQLEIYQAPAPCIFQRAQAKNSNMRKNKRIY